MPVSSLYSSAIAAIDAANALDPRRIVVEGVEWAEEVLYSRRMTETLLGFEPGAGEALLIAARAQHIRRWEIPRSSFPADRIGYLKWRTTLYQFHADRTGEILVSLGYDPVTIAAVRSLLKKEKIKQDADSQRLEDVICLVFLRYEFADFMVEHPDEAKLLNIIQRTWKKMSPAGHAAAMSLVPSLPQPAQMLLDKALQAGLS